MARPRTPAAETPPTAPPLDSIDNPPASEAAPGELSVAAEELDAIRKAAFEDGVAEGIRRAAVKELPLFERAKQLAREHALNGSTEPQLRDAISALEEERDTQLSRSDLDLVLAGYRRLRAHQAQRDEAAREPGRPRRPVPRERQPKQTEYEHIS